MRLPGLLFSYAAGLLSAPYLHLPPSLPALILLAATASLLSRTRLLSLCGLILCFYCTGLFQYGISSTPPADRGAIYRLNDEGPVILEGVIESMTSRFPQGAAATIAVQSSFDNGRRFEQSGYMQLSIELLDAPLLPGDTVRFRTKLRTPRLFGSPGEFDYPRHLARKGIFSTGFLSRGSDLVRLEPASAYAPASSLGRWRQHVGKIIDDSVPMHLAPYLKGLAIGDRGSLSPAQKKLLAHSGIAHLFAISGLHLGIIASFLYAIFRFVYRRLPWLDAAPPARVLPVLILPILVAYLLFTGSAISTLRALLGLFAVTLAFLMRRQVAPLQLLATAALTILLLDPLAIFTPAFQLSFAGAAGILCVVPRWQAFSSNWPKWLAYPSTLFVVTTAASLATLPLVLLHFHTLAPAGLALNMIAVPVVTLLAVPLCLFGVITAAFSPQLAAVVFNLAAMVLEYILNLAAEVLALPGFAGLYLYLPSATLLGVGLFSLALLVPVSLRFRMGTLVIALTLLVLPPLGNPRPEQLNVVAISVGQGDATLVTTPSGQTILIDGGGVSHSEFDTGERLVAPALGQLGIRELDAVVLTHDHPDHRNGLLHVLQHFSVRSFWSPTQIERLPAPLQTVLAERNIPTRLFIEGWTVVEQSETTKLAVYRVPGAPRSENDQSLVLYVQYRENGLLLPGDLERVGIARLLANPPPGPVTLLKIPHHGSRHSDPQPLITKFKPPIAYISVGYNNRYGHPHSSVLEQLSQNRLQLERTDLSGSLFFRTAGETWHILRWEKGLFR